MDQESGRQAVINEQISEKLERIEHQVNKIYKSLYQDNGGEALQSKVNRLDGEKQHIKKIVWTLITLNGGVLATLAKIAFIN